MAGSVTVVGPTRIQQGRDQDIYTIEYNWVADAADATVPATAAPEIDGLVFMAVTDPGAVAPTDLYDITLTDSDSCDVFGGELANRSTSAIQHAAPLVGNFYGQRYVKGAMTLNISGNAVNSATGKVKVYIAKI